VDPRTGLDAAEKRENLPCRESNSSLSDRRPSSYRLTYLYDEVCVSKIIINTHRHAMSRFENENGFEENRYV
jgi:hypothetical protein